jgi:hypothetical protein
MYILNLEKGLRSFMDGPVSTDMENDGIFRHLCVKGVVMYILRPGKELRGFITRR